MPRKITPDLLSEALAELEKIVEQLEPDNNDLNAPLIEEPPITQLESSTVLTSLNVAVPPNKK